MDKIKVVNVITDLNIGGAGKVLQNFYANCNYDKFEHWVIVPKGSSLIKLLKDIGPRVIAFEHLAPRSFSLKSIIPLTKLFKKIKPDIVHTHACFTARIAAKLRKNVKVVYTRHCVFEPGRIAGSFMGKLIGKVLFSLFADRAIAISPASMKNLTATGVPVKKIDVLMNGAEPLRKITPAGRLKTRQSLGIDENDFVFIMVGRLEEIKGHRFFIEAARRVLEKTSNVKFLIVGEGSIENELRKITVDMGNNIIFTGFMTDVYKAVNISDVMVNASYGTEASSLAIIEAMSIGKPVIASDYGGNPYQVEDSITGLIVPVKNIGQLAEAMLEIQKNKNLYLRMSLNSMDSFKSKFTAKIMTSNIEEIYRKLVEQDV
ncbi:MAG: glycosyltransferase [Clostridia bacterium]|nr:glycosyltransferase [Clostridia bacterium]